MSAAALGWTFRALFIGELSSTVRRGVLIKFVKDFQSPLHRGIIFNCNLRPNASQAGLCCLNSQVLKLVEGLMLPNCHTKLRHRNKGEEIVA